MKSRGRRVERRKEERKAVQKSSEQIQKERDLARSIAGLDKKKKKS